MAGTDLERIDLSRDYTGMDHLTKLMRVYRELVTDPAWQAEQERSEAEKLERFVRRLLEWDGVSEELPADSPKH